MQTPALDNASQIPKTNNSPFMNTHPETLRLFYALLPDEKTKAELQQWQIHVSGKKTPPENLHMTLFFLGNQAKKNLPALKRFLDRISFNPFEVKLDKIGYFPKIGLSWIGPEHTPASLGRLYDYTRQFVVPVFVKANKEIFRPHVTLARHSLKPEIKTILPVVWTVNRFVLMHSISVMETGRHAEYRILHEKTFS